MLLLKFLLFIVLIYLALANNIPHKENIFEVPADKNEVYETTPSAITAVSLKDGANYYQLRSLNIENQLLEMKAAESLIDKLTKVSSLCDLRLTNNTISGTFNIGSLQNLKKLEKFVICENEITEVVNTATENMPSVKIIDLGQNNLSSIDLEIFDRFPNLNRLGLYDNKISGVLDLGKLRGLKSLKEISIHGNQLTDVVYTATDDMPSVKHMTLGQTLDSIDVEKFKRFPNLQKLGLKNLKNTTTTLDLSKLKGLKSLEEFFVTGYKIAKVIDTSTENMPSVTAIQINQNDLNSIDLEVFKTFPNIEALILKDNTITGTLDLGKLKWLKNLQEITLPGNRIIEVVNTAAENMPSVTFINLGQNSLGSIDFESFRAFSNLELLILSDNKITGTLDLGKLKWFKNLELFFCDGNKITEIVYTASEKTQYLKKMNLDGNSLSSIDFDIFEMFPSLDELYLSSNKIVGTLDLNKLKKLKSLEKILFDKNEITDVVNTANENMPSVKEIYLNKNYLKYLDLKVFEKFTNLERLELNNNYLISIKNYEKAKIILPKIENIIINYNNFICSEMENMVSPHNLNFWFETYEIEIPCFGLKSQLFRGKSCCYPKAEDQMNDIVKKKC